LGVALGSSELAGIAETSTDCLIVVAFEAPTIVPGFDDVAVEVQTIDQHGGEEIPPQIP
jgi:hypothetical protein